MVRASPKSGSESPMIESVVSLVEETESSVMMDYSLGSRALFYSIPGS